MNRQTREWVAKAENDFDDAQRILRARNRTDFSNACFHAQQCAEKYMKAVLVENRRDIERIHDLTVLLKSLSTINPFWDAFQDAAKALTVYAVRFRYLGNTADKKTAKSALLACEQIRSHMRQYLRIRSAKPKKRAQPKTSKKRTR